MCCSTPGVGVLFCSVPLPFNSDGLLPFTSDGLKGFWFCFLARKVLGLLARSSGSTSWCRRSGSVPLPFNSDGLLPFSSDGLKGFWFDWRALRKLIRRKVLNVLFYSWRRSSVLFCSSTV